LRGIDRSSALQTFDNYNTRILSNVFEGRRRKESREVEGGWGWKSKGKAGKEDNDAHLICALGEG
jgi:hypothetical protein